MRRRKLGLAALVLLIVGLACFFGSGEDSHLQPFGASCIRVGMISGAGWLAYPELALMPVWAIAITCGSLLIVVRAPRMLPLMVGVALVLLVLRPRRGKKGLGRRSSGRRSSTSRAGSARR